MPQLSKFDIAYRRLLLLKYFSKGWGNPNHLKQLFEFRENITDRTKSIKLVESNPKIDLKQTSNSSGFRIYDGQFESPFNKYHPEVLPTECKIAKFQLIQPSTFNQKSKFRPLAIHLAGTGDHFFWRRRELIAKPLLKQADITSIILENPFYGLRKPKDQFRSSLNYVSDIFTMGVCLCLECLELLNWAENNGFGPLTISGLSMGGHMASIAGSNWHKPIGITPCLSWTTASASFTEGAMHEVVPWKLLIEQYKKDDCYKDLLQKSLQRKKETNPQCVEEDYTIIESISNNMIRMGTPKAKDSEIKSAINFMNVIMDYFTHLENYPMPVDPTLITIVNATYDAYFPKENVKPLSNIWKGSEVHTLNVGHVFGSLFSQNAFRKAIIHTLNKTAKANYGEPLLYKDPTNNSVTA